EPALPVLPHKHAVGRSDPHRTAAGGRDLVQGFRKRVTDDLLDGPEAAHVVIQSKTKHLKTPVVQLPVQARVDEVAHLDAAHKASLVPHAGQPVTVHGHNDDLAVVGLGQVKVVVYSSVMCGDHGSDFIVVKDRDSTGLLPV